MFIYLRHGDNEQFLVNPNCHVIHLLEHIKSKLELPKTDLVDLCDEGGTLKLLFLSRRLQDRALPQLPPRCFFTVCAVNRRAMDGAYVSISPLLANPDPALLENLQTQTDSLEKARLIKLRSQEDGRRPKTVKTLQTRTDGLEKARLIKLRFQEDGRRPKTVKSKKRGRAVCLDAAEVKPLPQKTGRRNRRS